MNKFTGKFEQIHEETLFRYQQGGFLRGDYAKIKKNALTHESVKQFSDQLKNILQDAIKNETMFRVSYIKSGQSESFSGPVDAANIPNKELWADCYVEHAPGMWHNVITIPLGVLEKVDVEGMNGFPEYNKNLVRPNTEEPEKPDKEMKDQTKGDDENRKLTKKNTKLANTPVPKDGRDQAKFKEGVEYRKENDLMFESYATTISPAQCSIADENDYIKKTIVPLVKANKYTEALQLFRKLYSHRNDNEMDMRQFINQITSPIYI